MNFDVKDEMKSREQSGWGRNIVLGCIGIFVLCLFFASLAINTYLGWIYLHQSNESDSVLGEELLTSEELIIEFGTVDHYYVRINNGLVVGGYAEGSLIWNVVGGAYDGRNLQVVFVTDGRADCKQWWSHNFLVDSNQVILRSSVDKCGNVINDRSIKYERLGFLE